MLFFCIGRYHLHGEMPRRAVVEFHALGCPRRTAVPCWAWVLGMVVMATSTSLLRMVPEIGGLGNHLEEEKEVEVQP